MAGFSLKHALREPAQASREAAPLLLLLHGLRSNEQDLIQLAPALDQRLLVVSARAPLAMEYGTYAWYNVEFLPDGYRINAQEAEHSRQIILQFVRELVESYHVDAQRVFVMGFSQGAAMAVSASLSEPRLFAGTVAMSGRLIEELGESRARPDEMQGLPVMVVHGTRDQVIPIAHGRGLRDELASLPVQLTYREYEMAHEVTARSIGDISAWMQTLLKGGSDWRTASV